MSKAVENLIKSKLAKALEATYLNIINESYMHNVPAGSETHFKVVVVSSKFDGLPLIKVIRHVEMLLGFCNTERKLSSHNFLVLSTNSSAMCVYSSI